MTELPQAARSAGHAATVPRFWLLVFDLDGTLIDSSLDLCHAVNAAMRHVGSPELPHELISGYVGDGAAVLVRRALGDPVDLDAPESHLTGRSKAQKRFEAAYYHFLAFYREHKLDNTVLHDGVFSALTQLRSADAEVPMAVLTNKPVRPSVEICDALGLSPFLFANYGGNSFPSKKPDPAGLLHTMNEARQRWAQNGVEEHRLPPTGVLMVGDSENDVLTARRAGATSLGCRYGLAPQALALAKPDLMCDSPREWPNLIAGLP